ncbi:hypothetical protein GC090_20330 (plasmid) [Pantoea sp. JZ29]|uniref:DnaT-like ssDNA-binding domain-containing protein n=1 Tax=Pantoea sp. JZ29 TaxID=2654192 RepID=UPI002B486E27|nr:DnaT-like ssDNA-binding domain-containing protein [Pantoea sp. JZ29]WRH23013.1 hypothetical protein GC090_20330 [Pantoea sp. JZ29]
MTIDWVLISPALKVHPKVNQIAAWLERKSDGCERLDVSFDGQKSALLTRNVTRCITVTGLLSIWGAAKEYAPNNVFINVDLSYLDVLAEFEGFGEAMAAVGWAVYDAENHCVLLTIDDEQKLGKSSKPSAAAERQRRYRDKKRAQKSVTQGVTHNVTRNASGVTQTVTRDVTQGVTRYACFNSLRSKTTHKNKNNTHRAREFSGFSVDNSDASEPQSLVAKGFRAEQGAKAKVLSQPMQPRVDQDNGVTRYVTQSITPEHNATVTQRNASAPVQRNAHVITQRDSLQQISPAVSQYPTSAESPEHKFVMFDGWQPSQAFTQTASHIGIKISDTPDSLQLADFVHYWMAENVAHYQSQWEIKLARFIEKGRRQPPLKRSKIRRDFTLVAGMDYAIPEGFRGG